MMAADSLRSDVPSGMSFCWLLQCRARACGAFAPHFALHPAQPSNVQASCLERARPAAIGAFAGALAAHAAAPPGRRCPERQRRAKAEGKTKDAAPAASKASLHMGERGTERLRRRAAFGARPRQCRHVRVLRTTGHARACRERSHDRPPRRRFRVRPSAPKNRGKGGQSFVSKVLKQAGKASSGKSAVRRPGAAGTGQRPGSRLGRGHTAARFAGAKLTPMSRRVTIKTLLVNHQRASPQSLAKHLRYIERDGAGRDGEPGRATGRRPTKPTWTPSRNAAPTTGTISASSSRPRTAPSWTTCAPTPGT
jgi:hypothetical protein